MGRGLVNAPRAPSVPARKVLETPNSGRLEEPADGFHCAGCCSTKSLARNGRMLGAGAGRKNGRIPLAHITVMPGVAGEAP